MAMERVKCVTCAAVVAKPVLDVEDRDVPRWKCACCENLLAKDSFGDLRSRRTVRRCLACIEGPETKAFWHKMPLGQAVDVDVLRRLQHGADVQREVTPPRQESPPDEEGDEKPKKKKRRRIRSTPRRRYKKYPRQQEQ